MHLDFFKGQMVFITSCNDIFQGQPILELGSGGGSFGRVIASDARGPWFESSYPVVHSRAV